MILLLICASTSPVVAQESEARSRVEDLLVPLPQRDVVSPVAECALLAGMPMNDVERARLVLTGAVRQKVDGVEFCHVTGMISPQIQFVLDLPTQTYQGRYLAGGCGGACGIIRDSITPECSDRHAKAGTFAVSFNNSGHVGPTMMDTAWAVGAPQLQVDFAYRASHLTALAAKQVIARYYGGPPQYSYFVGCSNGGREAMMEVQRYPNDFDGVLAGAPAIWISSRVLRILWQSRINTDAKGAQILTDQATEILHRAVLDACDGLDGLKDGQLDMPRSCSFDPATLICKEGEAQSCITPRQAEIMRQFYEGPVDDDGRHLYLGGYPYGSELLWAGDGSLTAVGEQLVVSQVRDMIFDGHKELPAHWREWKLDTHFLRKVTRAGGFYQANDPYIKAFKDSGGKLIIWQGMADPSAGPQALLDYYQRVRDALGGFSETDSFLKAYFIPGVYHCRGGYVAYQFDLFGPLVNWVERDHDPNMVASVATLADGRQRARPIYPYPAVARYDGSGNPDVLENFYPEIPDAVPNDHYKWAAEDMVGGRAPLEY